MRPTGSIACRRRQSPPPTLRMVRRRHGLDPPALVQEAGRSLGRGRSMPPRPRLTVHEPFKTERGRVLLEGDGKPLVLEKKIGEREGCS